VPGTLRDSMILLDGLLEQQTVLEPQEIMTDTAGASNLVFGLFWLLGYQFSPRLADIGSLRFWRFDFSQDYGALNCVGRHIVDQRKIEHNWEDILRVAGSLKMGTVSASELTRSLLRSERPTTLAKAISELGKIPKTLHLLNYIRDESYRRRILVQLNRTESRHKWAREVCHGQRGQIRKRYREGQEDQLNALGLVLNAMVLWNTVYMEHAIQHLKASGVPTRPSDIARLSPLESRTINLLGRYNFALPETIADGSLRPLRQLDNLELVNP
jgi:TnpA family transposase